MRDPSRVGSCGGRDALWSAAWSDVTLYLSLAYPGMATSLSALTGLALSRVPGSGPADIVIGAGVAGGFVVIAGVFRYEVSGLSDLWLRVISLMGGLFLERTRQLIVHAGAIRTDAGAILFSGPSYVGKSTLALCAWQAGMTLLGDDRLMYHPGTAMVSAFPKPLKPRVDSVSPNDDSDGSRQFLGRLENEGHLVIPRSLAGMTPLDESVPVYRVFFLDRSRSSSSDLRLLTAAEALPRWMNQMMLSQSHTVLSTLPALEKWAKAGRVHGLRIGVHDIQRALQLMLSVK